MLISRPRFAQALALVLLTAAWLGGCSDGPCPTCPPPPPDPEGLIVSDPVPTASVAARAGASLALTGAAEDTVVFVSLPPGTAPAGSRAVVRRVGESSTLITAVSDGGFDPVPISARLGDSIDVLVTNAGGGTVVQTRLAVASRRPPVVVRSNPPKKKTDVPLNSALVLVFSEPVAPGSLTPSSVQLLRGTTVVPGTVSLLEGSATAAVFTPAAALDQGTDYRLVVTQAVRDLGGDPLAASVAVEFTTGTITLGSPQSVTVEPDTTLLLINQQLQLTVSARDTLGHDFTGLPTTWSSLDPVVATVSSTGLVTARAEGAARIQADVGGPTGVGVVLVAASVAPVDSVEVSPAADTIPVGGSVKLTAVLRDAGGNILRFRPVGWATSDPTIASAGPGSGEDNVVTGVAPGTVRVTATSEGHSDTASITVVSPGPYVSVDVGFHSCAVTTGGWAFCWGYNNLGQLGNGTSLNSPVPTGVRAGPVFSQITAPWGFTSCGVTPAGTAYCWGANWAGALGIGTTTGPELCSTGSPCSTTPVAVSGGLQFATIASGEGYVCGLTTGGAAHCWGRNGEGRLGTGTATAQETAPVAVAGGLTFTSLSVGYAHACGLTATGDAYCWGGNQFGGLGDGTTTDRGAPVQVVGGQSFVTLSAGYYHTCGLIADGTAYCWGFNAEGQLGNGGTTNSPVPVPMAGTLKWASISAGYRNTCAVTPAGAAYCWGDNSTGALGNGTTQNSTSPVAVTGGLTFANVSAGGGHTCGVTLAGVAYCWGNNYYGELGTGSAAWSTVPVKVAGQP